MKGKIHLWNETGTEGGMWAFQDEKFISHGPQGEAWSYDGLHVLKDGDKLTIYDKEDPAKVVWQGVIDQQHYGSFQEHAYDGQWIHSDQRGVEREVWSKWFIEEYPAELEKLS